MPVVVVNGRTAVIAQFKAVHLIRAGDLIHLAPQAPGDPKGVACVLAVHLIGPGTYRVFWRRQRVIPYSRGATSGAYPYVDVPFNHHFQIERDAG